MADSEKWGTTALQTITDWSAVDLLVTDDALPQDARAALAGTEILTVAPSLTTPDPLSDPEGAR